jgi:hypothetical protein
MNTSDIFGANFPSTRSSYSNSFSTNQFNTLTSSPDNMSEVLSRYHFMGMTQTRNAYSEYSLGSSSIRIEKIVRITVPSNPEVSTYLRQLKLYFYLTDSRGKIVPLKGTIQLDRRLNLGSSNDESSWMPVSVSNVEWSFMENEDPNERYNRLLFSPLKIEPSHIQDGVNIYEIRIRFEPEIPIGRSLKIYTRGSDKQQMGNIEIYHPAMSVYFTTCPHDPDYRHNLLLEVISSLIGMADKSGVYNNTEYNGAPSKILAAIPQLRVPNDIKKQLTENQSGFQTVMDKLNELLDRQPNSSNFTSWAGQINIDEISRLRTENAHLRQQLSHMELNN